MKPAIDPAFAKRGKRSSLGTVASEVKKPGNVASTRAASRHHTASAPTALLSRRSESVVMVLVLPRLRGVGRRRLDAARRPPRRRADRVGVRAAVVDAVADQKGDEILDVRRARLRRRLARARSRSASVTLYAAWTTRWRGAAAVVGGPQHRLKQVATPVNSLAHAHREAFGAHGSQSQAHGGSDEDGGAEQKASHAAVHRAR